MTADDSALALTLFAGAPKAFGGVWLRGRAGPARDAILEQLGTMLRLRRCPVTIEAERLSGGIDLGASLAAGRAVHQPGLIIEAWDSVLVLHGAERAGSALTAALAQARDAGGPALLLVDEGLEDEGAPTALTDRVAFRIDTDALRDLPEFISGPATAEILDAEQLTAVTVLAARLGVESLRTAGFAVRTAGALASFDDRDAALEEDLIGAARLVLAPRATQMPADDAPEPPPAPEESAPSSSPEVLEDVVLDAVRPALLPDLIERNAARSRRAGRGAQGRGERGAAKLRGRPTGARAGLPGAGVRLALVETLRTAAPWQAIRGRTDGRIALRRDDLRIRRFEDRRVLLTVVAVDASGSAAASRLAEAKGAVEMLLERAYARRAEVALIAFRGSTAELMVPPTRSLTRARRLLADMVGGGTTPLAAGLDAARLLAEAAGPRGRTPQIVVLTDGRGNVATDGRQGRVPGQEDALKAARRIAASGVTAVVVDIGARPQPEAQALAAAMGARSVHLPRAEASALAAAVAT